MARGLVCVGALREHSLQHRRLWSESTIQAEHQAPAGPRGTGKWQEKARSWAPSPGKVLLRLHSTAGLRRHHHTLLAMVHAPEAVELRKVHVRLDAAILAGRERVGGPGAEKAPVRAGAAALGVRVGGLQGQGRALAGSTTGANQ